VSQPFRVAVFGTFAEDRSSDWVWVPPALGRDGSPIQRRSGCVCSTVMGAGSGRIAARWWAWWWGTWWAILHFLCSSADRAGLDRLNQPGW